MTKGAFTIDPFATPSADTDDVERIEFARFTGDPKTCIREIASRGFAIRYDKHCATDRIAVMEFKNGEKYAVACLCHEEREDG